METLPLKRVIAVVALSFVVACGSDSGRADTSAAPTAPTLTAGGTASTASSGATAATDVTGTTGSTSPIDTTGTTATEGSATMGSGPIDPGLQPYIDIAVADLTERLGVGVDRIEVSSATLEQWPDSSLGCPQKGMQYAQVLTDGALIVLTSDGKTYKYHAGGSRPPFYCADSKATPSG